MIFNNLFLNKISKLLISINFIFITFLLSTLSLSVNAYQELDRVIALVDDSPITIRNLEDYLSKQKLDLNATNINIAVKKLINKRLLVTEANRLNIKVNNQILDQQILNIAKRNNTSLKKFYKQVQTNYPGGYINYRKNIRFAILEDEVKRRIIYPRINKSLLKLSQGLEKKTKNIKKEKQILLQQIHISNTDTTAYSKINEAYNKIKSGANFAEVAKIYSDESSIEQRGKVIGWVRFKKLDNELKSLYQGLDNQEVSHPRKIKDGWIIVKLVNSRQIETEIINKLRSEISAKKINEELNLWLNELRAFSYVEIRDKLLAEYINQL